MKSTQKSWKTEVDSATPIEEDVLLDEDVFVEEDEDDVEEEDSLDGDGEMEEESEDEDEREEVPVPIQKKTATSALKKKGKDSSVSKASVSKLSSFVKSKEISTQTVSGSFFSSKSSPTSVYGGSGGESSSALSSALSKPFTNGMKKKISPREKKRKRPFFLCRCGLTVTVAIFGAWAVYGVSLETNLSFWKRVVGPNVTTAIQNFTGQVGDWFAVIASVHP